MSAITVWNRICSYNSSSSKTLMTMYQNDVQLIIKTLEGYPNKDEYHGHESGGSGDGENPAGATNRNLAIEFLTKNAPKHPIKPAEKPKPDYEKKSANLNAIEKLTKIINEGSNKSIPTVADELFKENPKWKDKVWEEFCFFYRVTKKKDKNPDKSNYN